MTRRGMPLIAGNGGPVSASERAGRVGRDRVLRAAGNADRRPSWRCAPYCDACRRRALACMPRQIRSPGPGSAEAVAAGRVESRRSPATARVGRRCRRAPLCYPPALPIASRISAPKCPGAHVGRRSADHAAPRDTSDCSAAPSRRRTGRDRARRDAEHLRGASAPQPATNRLAASKECNAFMMRLDAGAFTGRPPCRRA